MGAECKLKAGVERKLSFTLGDSLLYVCSSKISVMVWELTTIQMQYLVQSGVMNCLVRCAWQEWFSQCAATNQYHLQTNERVTIFGFPQRRIMYAWISVVDRVWKRNYNNLYMF